MSIKTEETNEVDELILLNDNQLSKLYSLKKKAEEHLKQIDKEISGLDELRQKIFILKTRCIIKDD